MTCTTLGQLGTADGTQAPQSIPSEDEPDGSGKPQGNHTGGCCMSHEEGQEQRPAGPQPQSTCPLAVGQEPAGHQGPGRREDPGLGFQRERGLAEQHLGVPIP